MRKRGQSNFPVTPTLLSSYWKIALTPFSAGKDLDVLERRVVGDGDLVLDQHAAVRAAELSELRCWIDEAPRIADERVRRLDRQVVAHAVSLVVVADRAEVGAALRAAAARGAPRAGARWLSHRPGRRRRSGAPRPRRRRRSGRRPRPSPDRARADRRSRRPRTRARHRRRPGPA